MSHHIEKQFRNTATTPIVVAVIACADGEGIVREIHAAGGTLGFSDGQRAESQRMHRWIRDNFIGQHYFFFNAHNGIVSDAKTEKPKQPEIHIINTIDFSPEATAEAMKGMPGLIERILRRDFEKGSNRTTVGAASDKKEARAVAAGHPGYELAPKVGTYWQDRSRILRFFVVLATHECEGHSHIRMLRVDNQRGGEYEFAFTTTDAWDRDWKQVSAAEVPGLHPYQAAAANFLNVSFKPARSRAEQRFDNTLNFRGVPREVGMPRELGMGYNLPRNVGKTSDSYLEAVFRDFIGGVPFEGEEQPPAAGERYHSMISDQTYTVIDVRRKLHSTDHYVTMERDHDGHRTKFTYRDHATWLTVWRPLDEDGKKHVKVEVVLDASDAMRQVGEAAHAAAEAAMDFRETDAERQLRILYSELDRRVPGWRDAQQPSGAFVDELGLAIRAIRSINKHMKNYQQIASTFGDRDEKHVAQINELVKAKNHFKTRTVELEHELKVAKERYPLPAIGSVWRNRKTDSYQTVTHLFQGSVMARMKTGRNTEFDTTVENLFANYVLVTGPELNMAALGEFKCNAYGLHQQQVLLKDMIAGSVFNANAYSMSSDGQVTIQGILTKRAD